MRDDLSLKLAALAHPVRRRMIERLARGSATVGELGEPFGITAPAVSNHVRVLVEAGLVDRTVEAQHRRVSLRRAALGEIEAWIGELRSVRGEGLDRLEARLAAIRRQLGRTGAPPGDDTPGTPDGAD